MFKSTQQSIVIPQSEHLKLAGALALLWGNDQFERPPLPYHSVMAGIALHDRSYGYVDNVAIGDVDEETWLAITRRGFYMPCSDMVADVITRHHLLRLVSGHSEPAYQALKQEMEQVLQAQMAQSGFSAELFKQVDTLTKLCDMISFDFCFGDTDEGTIEVVSDYGRNEKRAIHYRIVNGQITLDPWPLQVEIYQGYLVGYHLAGYPEQLDGVIIPYQIQPI